MPDRIDLLGTNVERERLLGAGLLEVALQSNLNEFAHRAAELTSYPIALISLLGKRTQFFAATAGLAPELVAVGGTDRSVSLCQRIVRDNRAFGWEDATLDLTAPQGMVNTYGIRAYFGAPLVVHGVVVGSVCVADLAPRALAAPERAAIEALAHEISAQLERDTRELLRGHVSDAEIDAVEPIFGELRNILVPLTLGVADASLASAELQTALRLLSITSPQARERVASVLLDTMRAGDDLGSILTDMCGAQNRLVGAIEALESLFHRNGQRRPIALCVSHARTIAEHVTRLVGGVRVASLASPNAQAVARTLVPAIALLLGAGARRLIASRAMGGLDVGTHDTPDGVLIEIGAPGWSDDDVGFCVRHARSLLIHEPSLTVLGAAGRVQIHAELARSG